MSEVSICNQAITWLGGTTIISLLDDSQEAKLCNANYDAVRDAVLEAHNWTFAIQRFNLAASATPPQFGYAAAYPLPSTALRVIDVNKLSFEDPTRTWVVEDGSILTDDSYCKCRCVVQVTDTAKFSPLFTQALAARLAADLAIPLTQSRSLQQDMWTLYTAKLKEAATIDGLQGRSRKLRSRWLSNARNSGYVRAVTGPEV